VKVEVIELKSNKVLTASIKSKEHLTMDLPSFNDGWRFSFDKHSKNKNFQTYILVCDTTPEVIEGCLIFKMKNQTEPYMAYIEVAPHNKGRNKEKENVAGCLIAFACRLSFINGQGDYQGWLAFDVLEEYKKDEIKLMTLYSKKYFALKFKETTMVIPPKGGEILINEFLNS